MESEIVDALARLRSAIRQATLGVRQDALLALLLVNLIDEVANIEQYEREVGYDSEFARSLSSLGYDLEVAGVKHLGSLFVEMNCDEFIV